MASEFTRKVRNINDIKEYPTTYDNNGDVLITKGDEIYMLINDVDKVRIDNRDVEGEIKKATDLSNEAINKADKSSQDTQKVSQDLINLKNVDNNWTGNNTFTQAINGSFKVNDLFLQKDLNLAVNQGIYSISGASVINSPSDTKTWLTLVVYKNLETSKETLTQILIGQLSNKIYTRNKYGNTWSNWQSLAYDGNVIHNTGNETSSGDKTLNGQTTLLNGNYGLRVTNSGIMKTSDAGKTWVNI